MGELHWRIVVICQHYTRIVDGLRLFKRAQIAPKSRTENNPPVRVLSPKARQDSLVHRVRARGRHIGVRFVQCLENHCVGSAGIMRGELIPNRFQSRFVRIWGFVQCIIMVHIDDDLQSGGFRPADNFVHAGE